MTELSGLSNFSKIPPMYTKTWTRCGSGLFLFSGSGAKEKPLSAKEQGLRLFGYYQSYQPKT